MADNISNCHVALTAAVNVLTQFILDDPLQ